jgi:hypothetical protein
MGCRSEDLRMEIKIPSAYVVKISKQKCPPDISTSIKCQRILPLKSHHDEINSVLVHW